VQTTNDPVAVQEMEDSEGQRLALHALENLVGVGQEYGQAGHPPLQPDKGDEVRVDDGLELVDQVAANSASVYLTKPQFVCQAWL